MVWLTVLPASRGQVTLNEVLADNRGSLVNGDTYPDWVELWNGSGQIVDLGGWTLTDNLSQPAKFTFPPATHLAPGATLLVFCDSEFSAPGWHTGFGLDSEGEQVALFSPANPFAPVDLIVFGLQLPDAPIGRFPDATGAWTLTYPTPGEANQGRTVGALTNLFINEWMADASSTPDWLELYNADTNPVALGGLVWTDSTGFPANPALPPLSFIGPEGFIQFWADDQAQPGARHLDFKLSNNGETVTLYQADRLTPVDRVIFGPQFADRSQGRLPDGGANLVFFPVGRETPAASNFLPLTDVAINEVLSHSDPPLEDAIELVNLSATPINIGYWWLSDSKNDPRKYQIPANTILPPYGFHVFYEYQFNPSGTGVAPSFSLNSALGDEVYLHTGDAAGTLTGYRVGIAFGPADNGVSFGRHLTSQAEPVFVAMSRRTFGVDHPASLDEFRAGTGLSNAPPRVGPLLLNEIMYHPPDRPGLDDNTLNEYVEIFNLTQATVPLYDPAFPTNQWRLSGGVEFVFPPFVHLAARSHLLLVSFDPVLNPAQLVAFRSAYQVPDSVPIYGPYQGKLSNQSDRLDLFKPDTPQGPGRPDAGLVPLILMDRVEYQDRAPWPEGADGTGSALQRVAPEQYGNDPVNWFAAPPTPGTDLIRFDSITRQGAQLVLRFRQIAGQSCTVQRASRLPETNWEDYIFLPASENTLTQSVADLILPWNSARFYRLHWSVPPP